MFQGIAPFETRVKRLLFSVVGYFNLMRLVYSESGKRRFIRTDSSGHKLGFYRFPLSGFFQLTYHSADGEDVVAVSRT